MQVHLWLTVQTNVVSHKSQVTLAATYGLLQWNKHILNKRLQQNGSISLSIQYNLSPAYQHMLKKLRYQRPDVNNKMIKKKKETNERKEQDLII